MWPFKPSSGFSKRRDSELRAAQVSKAVIQSVNASLTHGVGGGALSDITALFCVK